MNMRLAVACVLVGMLACLCSAAMNLVILPKDQYSAAKCLDGTPAAFYFHRATNSENATKWVLFLQGGGFCYTDKACLTRTRDPTGSSNLMEKTMEGRGFLSDDPKENPDFHSWNIVVFAYCDGGCFTGMRRDPVKIDGKSIYYRGYYNLEAIISELKTKYGMDKATEVLLSGGSAGGVSTFIHADQIAGMLPHTVKSYKAVAFSGINSLHPNIEGKKVFEEQMKSLFHRQNSTHGVDSHCMVAQKESERHLCMFSEVSVNYLITPIFASNSIYDPWSLKCIWAEEPVPASSYEQYNCAAVPGWKKCIENGTCTSEQWKEFNTKWGDEFRHLIKTSKGLNMRGNGVFAYSCHIHVPEYKQNNWNHIKVNGATMREAFVKWYTSKNEEASKHTYVDCKINGNFHCNPTCPK